MSRNFPKKHHKPQGLTYVGLSNNIENKHKKFHHCHFNVCDKHRERDIIKKDVINLHHL